MTTGQKTAFSLLISVLIFAVCAVAAFTGGFKLVEARFYEPRVIQGIDKQLDGISDGLDDYFSATIHRFAQYASQKSVKTFVESTPADADVKSRTTVTGNLFAETSGLVGIRLVDSNGRYLHYSTYSKDIFKKTERSVSFTDYDKLGELPYNSIASADSDLKADTAEKLASCCSVLFDSSLNRIIFSMPYYDKFMVYRGTIVFYVDSADFTRFLVARNTLTLSDSGTLIAPAVLQSVETQTESESESKSESTQTSLTPSASNSGIVFGLPAVGKNTLVKTIVDKWNAGLYGTEHLVSTDSGDWILLTSITSKYGRIGWVYNETIFTFPQSVKILLLVCIFITLFLVVFMLFNLKHDDMVIIRDRIKRFQLALLTEYVDRKETDDWQKISADIALRKQDVTDEIKRSLGRRGKRHGKELDALLERSWDEILVTLGGKRPQEIGSSVQNEENTAKIKEMLEDILSKGTVTVRAIQSPQQVKPLSASSSQIAEPVEEIPEAEPVEEVQSVEPVEEIPEAEPVEEVQSVEPVEEIPEAEPVEEVQSVEPVEEIPEAEPVEEIPEAEPVEEVQSVEPVEEIPEAEPVEEVQSVEPVEEIPAAEPVEEIPEAEPVEEVQSVEPVEEIPEAEPVEEVSAVEPVEEVQSVEPVEEIPEAEPVEEISEAEPVEEIPAENSASSEEPETAPVDTHTTESHDFDTVLDSQKSTDDFEEPMAFGVPSAEIKAVQCDDSITNFTAVSLDFSDLDKKATKCEAESEAVALADFEFEQNENAPHQPSVTETGFEEDMNLNAGWPVEHTPEITKEHTTTDDDFFTAQVPLFTELDEPKKIPLDTTPVKHHHGLLDRAYTVAKKTKLPPVKQHGLLAAAKIAEKKVLSTVPEVETLAPQNAHVFSLTGLGHQQKRTVELKAEKDAIVEQNGVFTIQSGLETSSIKQDPSFRKLVESVLR